MTKQTAQNIWNRAWSQGFTAVTNRPPQPPVNPYDEDKQPLEYVGWAAGAEEAGISITSKPS